ncbi:Hypothetical predicted protein [Mytilus galloprovincialis]|uniref:Uncharacterized protein n=1 Tax=Mytilus galloprovincialis TaxID=29158 RepID=A0A8B6DUJ8_MYTGA|nr:Hypothetical predicted protein [Mytilus galloprovincialis]
MKGIPVQELAFNLQREQARLFRLESSRSSGRMPSSMSAAGPDNKRQKNQRCKPAFKETRTYQIDDVQQRNLQSGEQVPVRNIWIRERSVEGKITLRRNHTQLPLTVGLKKLQIEMLTVKGFTLQEEDDILVCTDESGDIKNFLCARYLVEALFILDEEEYITIITRPREVNTPTTPILTRSIKPISPLSEISPCSISLGIEDYSSVSPVKKNLVDLFDSPTRQAVEEPREETSMVPEKPTPEPSTVTTTLRDSRHLALPAIGDEVCPEDRFQAPPSRFQCSYEASKCMLVVEKAKKTGKYTGSVLPVGYGCVKKEEMCILPDGTVYKLSATWVPDPSFQILKSEDTQTEERQVQQTSTQTVSFV